LANAKLEIAPENRKGKPGESQISPPFSSATVMVKIGCSVCSAQCSRCQAMDY